FFSPRAVHTSAILQTKATTVLMFRILPLLLSTRQRQSDAGLLFRHCGSAYDLHKHWVRQRVAARVHIQCFILDVHVQLVDYYAYGNAISLVEIPRSQIGWESVQKSDQRAENRSQ